MTELGQPTRTRSGDSAAGGVRRTSIWPHVEERVADLIGQHRSTIVFANSRRLAERLTARLNEIAAERAGGRAVDRAAQPARPQIMAQSGSVVRARRRSSRKAHHGSVSKEQRALIEDDLKRGRLPCVVATSSLELGIDMGAVDLVIQVESPPSVASALQRVGRAGHQVGEVSRGVLFPKHRGDLAQTAVAVERMRSGAIESLRVPTNPLDVLAQQIVAAVALDAWDVDELYRRWSGARAASPRSRAAPTTRPSTCWPAATRPTSSPSCGRASSGTASPAPSPAAPAPSGSPSPAAAPSPTAGCSASSSSASDRARPAGRRARRGDGLRVPGRRRLRARRDQLADRGHHPRPGPGHPGARACPAGCRSGRATPSAGRPSSAQAIGAFTRELGRATRRQGRSPRAREHGLDEWAADNLVGYLAEQRRGHQRAAQRPDPAWSSASATSSATGGWSSTPRTARPSTRRGRWRSTPGCASGSASTARRSRPTTASCSGSPTPTPSRPAASSSSSSPTRSSELVTSEVGGSALFASRFRECAARALLLPRRDPGRRSPLWQQRQRSAAAARGRRQVPVVPDRARGRARVPPGRLRPAGAGRPDARGRPARGPGRRRRDHTSRRRTPAACCSATSPSSSTRATPRSPSAAPPRCRLDQGLLAELLGRAELRELLDPEVLAEVEAELQRLAPDRRARDAEGVADLLRLLGPLTADEVAERSVDGRRRRAAGWRRWPTTRRVVEVRVAGEERWAAIEDVGRLRDGLGVPVPPGTPDVFPEPVDDPLADLVSRYARTHGPFTAARGRRPARARRRPSPATPCSGWRRQGRVLEGEFRPSGSGTRVVRRRGAAQAAAPLAGPAAPGGRAGRARGARAASSPPGSTSRATDAAGRAASTASLSAVEQLAGCPVPASALEPLVLAAAGPRLRAGDARRAHRHRRGHLGRPRGAARAPTAGSRSTSPTRPRSLCPTPSRPRARPSCTRRSSTRSPRAARGSSGSCPTPSAVDRRQALSGALWDLVWAGLVTNDTLAPLRALARSGTHHPPQPPSAATSRGARPGRDARAHPDRPRPPAAGRCCPASTPTRPGARTPRPSGCSTGTAW